MLKKLFKKLGYIKRDAVQIKLLKIISEIEDEINSRPQYPNIGKKGCLRRIKELYISEFK